MKISTMTAEEQPPNTGQDRIPKVLVQKRHGPRRDSAFETIAHDHVESSAQFLDERGNRGEVVAIIRISHDDELASCRSNTAAEGTPVAPGRHLHHARSHAFRYFDRSILASVIGNQYFAANPQLIQGRLG